MGEYGAVGREAVVGPMVRKVLVGPYLPHDFHRLLEQRPVLRIHAGVRIGMKLGTLIRPDPPAEPDFHAPPGHVVQRRQVFGQPYRMPPRGYVGHLSDADPQRPRRQVRSQQDRVRQIAHSVGPEVVLPQPHGLEAQLLGQDGLLPEVVHQLLGVGRLASGRRHGRECREFHARNPPCLWLFKVMSVMVADRDTTGDTASVLGH